MQAAKDAAGEEGEDAEEEEIDPDDVRYACLNCGICHSFHQTDNP